MKLNERICQLIAMSFVKVYGKPSLKNLGILVITSEEMYSYYLKSIKIPASLLQTRQSQLSHSVIPSQRCFFNYVTHNRHAGRII